ncbi:MAG: class I SAM-dependent methyltransferase, partial [Phycisphaerales bacterium]|nr:class I SAM-dependent methyltransferase [Phycisphaerales bacterium]
VGIDLSRKLIEHAKGDYPAVDFRCMDMRAPDFEPASFDGILGLAAFCHLASEEVASALHHYRSLLREDGAIVLWIMDSQQVHGYVVEEWCGVKDNRVEMICHDRNWVKRALQGAGFAEIEIIPVSSEYYEAIPRIRENAIDLYIATGRASTPPGC